MKTLFKSKLRFKKTLLPALILVLSVVLIGCQEKDKEQVLQEQEPSKITDCINAVDKQMDTCLKKQTKDQCKVWSETVKANCKKL